MKSSKNAMPFGLWLLFLYISPLCLYLQTFTIVNNHNYFAFIYIMFTSIVCVFSSKWRFKISGNEALVLAFLVLLMLFTMLAKSFLFLFQSLLLCILILQRYEDRYFETALSIFQIVGLVNAVACIFQYYLFDYYLKIIRLFFDTETVYTIYSLYSWDKSVCGFMPQTSHAAGIILVSLIISFFLKNHNYKYLLYIEQLVLLFALLLTNKRAHFLFGLIAFLFTVISSEKKTKKESTLLWILFFLLALTLTVILIAPYLNPESTISSLVYAIKNFSNADADVTSDRIELAREAIEMIKTSPVLGHGWGSFKAHSIFGTDAHNVYLQVFAEHGLLIGVLYIVLVLYNLYFSFHSIKTFADSSNDRFKAFLQISFCYQLFFVLYGFTGNCLYNIDFLSMYVLMVVMNSQVRKVLYEKEVPYNY